MRLGQLRLRQKLLLLLGTVGMVGMGAFALMIVYADHRVFDHFAAENRALRDVEARSSLLLQNYYRFMLTPDLIDTEIQDADLLLIHQSLERYRQLSGEQAQKQRMVASIDDALETLQQAGSNMVASRQDYVRTFARLENLEHRLDSLLRQHRGPGGEQVERDSEAARRPEPGTSDAPELRLIEQAQRLQRQLLLAIRTFQSDPDSDALIDIDKTLGQIDQAATMLQQNVEISDPMAELKGQMRDIYRVMRVSAEEFTRARKQAGFAVSRAEQAGIDLNQALGSAVLAAETEGWRDLRDSLYAAGAILLLTLLTSYLLIYAGLDRILRPLEQLQVVITRLGKGDFRQRSSDVGRRDEIGQLATAFNRMAEQLEQSHEQKQDFISQLEQKNLELERFTYTVSHELKSPLVTVSGFIGLLHRDLAADKRDNIAQDMAKIANAVATMNRQLDDLLELSRVGRVINPPTEFCFTDLCLEVVQMMQGLIDERGARVEVQDDMPAIYADQARIREVIKNLVENGIKFTPMEREPLIEIEAEVQGERLLCRVRDNGPGIEPRYQSRVFGLFDRLDNSVPGTGIGLALVRRIVELHDGSIWIESRGDGQGSCFCFTLPLQRGN